MRCTILAGPGDIQVIDVPPPELAHGQEAIIRVRKAAICGTDLWAYRGIASHKPGHPIGHELIGVLTDIGSDVRGLAVGDEVVAPFSWNCGMCDNCQAGWTSSCESGGVFGHSDGSSGGQSDYVLVPYADATLVRLPAGTIASAKVTNVLLCGDILATGLHANRLAGTRNGDQCVVIGDGSVGLAAAMLARRAGAEHVTLLGHHEGRLTRARDVDRAVLVAGSEPRAWVPGGIEGDVVIDCVGTQGSTAAAVSLASVGGRVAVVGVPHGVTEVPVGDLFRRNVDLRYGLTPARSYLPELVSMALNDELDASWLVDSEMDLADVAAGYSAMAARSVLKVLLDTQG